MNEPMTMTGPYTDSILKARPDVGCTELLCAIRDCEQSRLTAQMSGFETGWEHPTTQTMWKRVVALSNHIQHNASNDASAT